MAIGYLHSSFITSCGLRLDDEAQRVSIGFRLGNIPAALVGSRLIVLAFTPLSCRRAYGRRSRFHALNDISWRAFGSAGIHVSKEPSGLLRDDGKRADGVSLIPWSDAWLVLCLLHCKKLVSRIT